MKVGSSSKPFVLMLRFYPRVVQEGDRIAQLILERIVTPEVLEVQVCISRCPCSVLFVDTQCRILMRHCEELAVSVRPVVMVLYSPAANVLTRSFIAVASVFPSFFLEVLYSSIAVDPHNTDPSTTSKEASSLLSIM